MRVLLLILLLAGCATEPQILTPMGEETAAPFGYYIYCARPEYKDAKECGGEK